MYSSVNLAVQLNYKSATPSLSFPFRFSKNELNKLDPKVLISEKMFILSNLSIGLSFCYFTTSELLIFSHPRKTKCLFIS